MPGRAEVNGYPLGIPFWFGTTEGLPFEAALQWFC